MYEDEDEEEEKGNRWRTVEKVVGPVGKCEWSVSNPLTGFHVFTFQTLEHNSGCLETYLLLFLAAHLQIRNYKCKPQPQRPSAKEVTAHGLPGLVSPLACVKTEETHGEIHAAARSLPEAQRGGRRRWLPPETW